LDVTKLTADIEIENTKHITSTGYTMGFWFFSSDKSLEDKVFKIVYEDHFMITVSTDTYLHTHCFIGLEYYNIEEKVDTASNLKILTESILKNNQLNIKKIDEEIEENKWRFIRCGYSYSAMKYYLEVNHGGIPNNSLMEENLNLPTYLGTDNMILPPRKFLSSNPKLKISSLNGLNADKFFSVRNIVLFADYIHPKIYFQYK